MTSSDTLTPDSGNTSGGRPRRRHRPLRWVLIALAVVLLLPLLAAGLMFAGATTEHGTRTLWVIAERLVPGHLSGTVRGTLTDGLDIRDLAYRDATRNIAIDRIDGRWRLTSSPWKLTIDHLRIGTVDVQMPPSTDDKPATLPASLTLPIQLDIRQLSVEQLVLRKALSETRLSSLQLRGTSDGVQHSLTLERLDTAAGRASAAVQLDGRQPYPLRGRATLESVVGLGAHQEQYRIDATLDGNLSALGIDVTAGGDKLHATARVQATPFALLPFERLQVQADRVNPKAFHASAPEADLSLHADLVPEKDGSDANASLAVTGPVSLTNAQAGAIDAGRLPLHSLTTNVRLDAQRQQLSALDIRLLQDGRITGQGELQRNAAGKLAGEFALAGQKLNLQALHGALQPTLLAGPVTVQLVPGVDAGVGAEAGATLDAQRITLDLADGFYHIKLASQFDAQTVRVQEAALKAGTASLNLSGQLTRTGNMDYRVQGTLDNFDPAQWMRSPGPKKSAPAKSQARSTAREASARSSTADNKARPIVRYAAARNAGSVRTATAASPAPRGSHGDRSVSARINMDFDASGVLAPEKRVKLAFNIRDSEYDKLPMTGGGKVEVVGQRLLPSDAQLSIAGNAARLNGSFGTPQDRLDINIEAPQLDRLGYGLAGALTLQAHVSGTLTRPNIRASYQALRLAFGGQRLASVSGQADVHGAALDNANALANARLLLTVEAKGVQVPEIALDTLTAKLTGTFGSHTLDVGSVGTLRGKPIRLTVGVQGKLSQRGSEYRWDGTLRTLENAGLPSFALDAPMPVSVAPQKLSLGASRMTVADAQIDLKNFNVDHGRLATEGAISAFKVATMLELVRQFTGAAPPVRTDLVLDGRWNIALADAGNGFAEIVRRSGDMIVGSSRGDIRLGLTDARLRADLQGLRVNVDARAAATRIGTISAQGQTTLQRQDIRLTLPPEAPLTARAAIRVPALKSVGELAEPQISLEGTLAMDLAAAGSIGKPKLSGTVTGDKLGVTLFDLGIQLRDGIVRIGLTENVVELRRIEFRGGVGTLRADGRVQLGESNPALTANVVADRLQLFANPDRVLILSGSAKAANIDDQFRIDGKFIVDRALFDLPKSNAPRLGDDVVIVQRDGNPATAEPPPQEALAQSTAKPAGSFAPVANIVVDLGNNFRFRGTGADLKLSGSMSVRSAPQSLLTATGTVQVTDGTYEAFGRKLAIERGLVNFQGPVNNPNINILAMRRNQEVAAGVEVTGFARAPRLRLVSEPAVSDEEKLSWLMFGHGTASAGTGQRNAAGAALTFLGNQGGKRLAKGIGLDEFSIGTSESGLNNQQVVSLGKAISERFTIGYEQSLTGAASIAKLTGQLSQHWSMIARVGAVNSLDASFSKRFD